MRDLFQNRPHGINRRTLLSAAAAGVAITACSRAPGEQNNNNSSGNRASDRELPERSDYRESPMLTELVESGDLPPLQERLPKEPFIVSAGLLVPGEFVDLQIGEYGGTLQLAQEDPSFDPVIFLGNIEPMLWAPGGFDYDSGIEGNVVQAYEANEDDTVFTFHMREGLRWSDGEPVTIEDVKFSFEDVLSDPLIYPVFPLYLRPGLRADREPAELEIVDDLTFSLKFSEPYGTFPAQVAIAQWRSYSDFFKPRHYLEKFHGKYTDVKTLRDLMAEESLPGDQWQALFLAKQHTDWLELPNEQRMGHPTLTAWIMTESSSGVLKYERNPYYFKIDMAGSQLPYIDNIRSQVVQDKETLTSRALFGEFDYLGERASLRQMPLIAEKAEAGEVKMHVAQMHRLPISFALNLSYDDPVWQEVVGDVQFRRALNMAINRQEIIDTFYLGEFAQPASETNADEYDVDGANALLDEMGMTEKDGDGFRLGPDGKRFDILFEIGDLSEDHIPMGELISEYWSKVGVHTTAKLIADDIRGERQPANQLYATSVWAHLNIWNGAGWDDYLPKDYWGPAWTDWYESQGEEGIEPPDEVKELYEIHGRLMSTRVGTDENTQALEDIKASYRDNVWTFNPVESSYYPTFWTPRVQNVPDGVPEDVLGIVINIAMEQWFIKE